MTEHCTLRRRVLQREGAGADNHWVVKLAQGARSADACLAHHLSTLLAYRRAPGGDRVVQKYVLRPILYDGRKFDVRVRKLISSVDSFWCFPCLCALFVTLGKGTVQGHARKY